MYIQTFMYRIESTNEVICHATEIRREHNIKLLFYLYVITICFEFHRNLTHKTYTTLVVYPQSIYQHLLCAAWTEINRFPLIAISYYDDRSVVVMVPCPAGNEQPTAAISHIPSHCWRFNMYSRCK